MKFSWMLTGKVLAAILTVASITAGAVLVTNVEGYAIDAPTRFWLTVFQTVAPGALFFLPRPRETVRGQDAAWDSPSKGVFPFKGY